MNHSSNYSHITIIIIIHTLIIITTHTSETNKAVIIEY